MCARACVRACGGGGGWEGVFDGQYLHKWLSLCKDAIHATAKLTWLIVITHGAVV